MTTCDKGLDVSVCVWEVEANGYKGGQSFFHSYFLETVATILAAFLFHLRCEVWRRSLFSADENSHIYVMISR